LLEEFKFPDTGEGVTEGKFLEWDIEEGEEIDEDQVVGKAETDKAVVDIPSPTTGVVNELKADPGDNVEVGDIIMTIEKEGSSNEEKIETDEQEDRKTEENKEAKRQSDEFVDPIFGGTSEKSKKNQKPNKDSSEKVLALPKVRKLAEKRNVNLSSLSNKGGRITESQVLEAAEKDSVQDNTKSSDNTSKEPSHKSNNIMATPSVRKFAREREVNLENIDGSGKGGKILRSDVKNSIKDNNTSKTTETTAKHTDEDEKRTERIEMSSIRKTIASKMSKSRFTAPHVTHTDKADVTELVKLREKQKEEVEAHLTYLPFISKAIYLAMQEYPRLNSELDEENDEVIIKNYYNFNIAVDTEKGLMVPKVEQIDGKSILEIAESIDKVVEKTRNNNLDSSDMKDGTFSITNIGVIGGESFTPIINYPQTAILGIGSIKETPEVYEGDITKRNTVKLSLSFDHRVIDGATAARFMNKIIDYLENPEKMLLELE